jgi:hypothetical protein
MIADLLETVAGIAEGILSGLEGRGPAATFQGPSVYEFIDDLVRTYPRSGVQRVDASTARATMVARWKVGSSPLADGRS